MPSLPESHAEPELLLSLTMLFLDKYSGTYRSREDVRIRLDAYLGNEHDGHIEWLNRETDMDTLVDLVITSGGVSIVGDDGMGKNDSEATAGLCKK